MEQPDYPIQGDINWRHTRTVKARGGGWGLWSMEGGGGGQRGNSPQTSKECHPTGSIHCWRPTVLTRPDFQSWDNVFQHNGSSSWRARLNKTRTQSPTINRGAFSGLFPFISVFSCVISPSVLPAIVHSWVILACVLFGQFSSAYPGPTQGLATIVKDAFASFKECRAFFLFSFFFLVDCLSHDSGKLRYPRCVCQMLRECWWKSAQAGHLLCPTSCQQEWKALVMALLGFHNDNTV